MNFFRQDSLQHSGKRRAKTGYIISLLIAAFLLSSIAAVSGEREDQIELVFFNPDTTAKNPVDATNALQTFANVVSKKLNLSIRAYFFKKQKDLDRFLGERKVEYGILSQMYIVENREKLNLVPFMAPVRNGKKTYRIVIVVMNDKGFNDIHDLKGKTLAATALGEDNIPFYNKVVFQGEIDVQTHFKEIKIVDSVLR
ncbi:PhnD/SsuA/transferrin family substrate-binding protein, partial [candidate division CSSED10-310 bacterium]